jgi:LPS O-antigen subunit length determinant protein (WzzB/FepE family)
MNWIFKALHASIWGIAILTFAAICIAVLIGAVVVCDMILSNIMPNP